jgi:hypothetical protein
MKISTWSSHDDALTGLRTAATRLLKQLVIIEDRIDSSWDVVWDQQRGDLHFFVRDCLLLDVETYYTVAADLLKVLICMIPAGAEQTRFKNEPCYKKIMAIRNHLVRHAYDKPSGDPYNGFGLGSGVGLMLKSGTKFRDPGHEQNIADLKALLSRYEIPQEPSPREMSRTLSAQIAGLSRRMSSDVMASKPKAKK